MKNDYKDDSRYICKSKINKKTLKKIGLGACTVKQVKNAFDECSYVIGVTGNSLDKRQQRHTKYVNLYELYKKTIKH